MELLLQNKLQHQIADLLWASQSQEQVDVVLKVFGHDARVVHDMMLASFLDDQQDTDQALNLINRIKGA